MSQPALVELQDEESLGTLSEAEERFERWRRKSGFFLAPAAYFVVHVLTAGHLTGQGSRLSAVLACTLVLWISESIPMAMASVLGACLCILLGVADAKTVLAPFADPILFLLIGSFILARAMMKHRLDLRFALTLLSLPWVREHPARLLCALGLVTALISMWVSNSAATAMMLPIALGLIHALGNNDGNPGNSLRSTNRLFATGAMLMVAYAASVGGIGTPVGTPPNLIGIGLIKNLAKVNLNFFQWMSIGIPLCVVMFAVLFFLLYWLHPVDQSTTAGPEELSSYLRQQRESLGGWTWGQVNSLIAFGVAVVLWVTPGLLAIVRGNDDALVKAVGERMPESVVALLAACLLFVLPTNLHRGEFTLNWKEAVRIDWGAILLFGGGMSLGGLMFSTGVATVIGKSVGELSWAQSLWGLTGGATMIAILMSEATSNTATANMVIPMVIAIAQAAHLNPVPPALGACLGASFGFMLPVSTAPNAIVYGSGLVPIPRMVRAGALFDLVGFVIIWVGLRILCPLLGWA
ncbi:MAG: DASS family sodium-coupled anion symporter [Armatimonadetes bacterium]|nr:DASS family sodium-coupled anion symporter [Armatimonadota bacterium]